MQFLEELNAVMFAVQKFTPTYVKELGITHGNYYKMISCLSPDHEDKNPSCSWWEEQRIYHCFSCGISFNIFKIASMYEGKPQYGKQFILENVFYLCKKYGVPYEHININFSPEDMEKFKQFQVFRILSDHILKYQNDEYLNFRKISKETASKLLIGSVNWDILIQEFQEANYDIEYLESLGIKKYNLNENKLVLIIKDSYGRPVSFVSREMKYQASTLESIYNIKIDKKKISSEKKEGKTDYIKELIEITNLREFEIEKYLNTPKYTNGKASLIYNKSKIFYGYSDIKNKINCFKPCYIVEGYLDFVSAYQAGEYNIMALGSASFTDEGLEFLEESNYIKKIAFALDHDKTGQDRTNSIVERLTAPNKVLEKKYFIAEYKEAGKDLDEIINNTLLADEKINLENIFNLKTMFDFVIEKFITKDASEEQILELVIPTILQEDSYLKRAELVKDLAKYINTYSEETILREINYRDDYEKKGVAKRFEKIFDKSKEKILREPKNIKVVLEELTDEVNKEYNKIYKKDENIFDKTLSNIREIENRKIETDRYSMKLDMDIFDDCTIRPTNVVTLAGRANSFKTTMFTNLSVNALKNNNNTMVFYLTTDDSVEKLSSDFIACIGNIPRVYAMDPINHPEWGLDTATDPIRANQLYKKYLDAYSQLEDWIKTKRLVIQHTSSIGDLDSVLNVFKNISEDEDLKDVFKIGIIDSLNNIEVNGIKDERQQLDHLSKTTKALAAKYNYNLFLNVELKKIGDYHKVSKQDLRGSVKMEYDCDALCVGNNNLHNLKGNTKLNWINSLGNKQPIVTLELEKSKINGYKFKPYFFALDGDFNQFFEIKKTNEKYEEVKNNWEQELNEYSNTNQQIL